VGFERSEGVAAVRTRWILTGIALVVWIASSGLSLPAEGTRVGIWRLVQCEGGVVSKSCLDSAIHQPSGYVFESIPQTAIQMDSKTHQPSGFVLSSSAGTGSLDSMRPDG
jgi:hypothetical protein